MNTELMPDKILLIFLGSVIYGDVKRAAPESFPEYDLISNNMLIIFKPSVDED